MFKRLSHVIDSACEHAQHALFGCDSDIYMGAAMEGELCRCSHCGQVWLRNFEDRHDIQPRRITATEAHELLVSVLR